MRSSLRILLVLSLAVAATIPVTGQALAVRTHQDPGPVGQDAVLEWNETATSAAVACGFTPDGNPPYESRLYAMTHIAIHDALNEIRPVYRPYTYNPPGNQPHASAEAAVAAAASAVLTPGLAQIAPGCTSTLVADTYRDRLAAIADGPAKTAGIAIGVAAAAQINGDRALDLAVTGAPLVDPAPPDGTFIQGTAPGQWRFTPDRPFAFLPNWGKLTPFTMSDSSQFGPSGPYDLRSRAYARDFNEIKSLGSVNSTTRTPEQTEIALFWVNSSPLQWNAIARSVSTDNGSNMGLWQHARLFAMLNAVMADGYIGSFATKYLDPDTKLFWRPVTAIREGSADGNPSTTGDPSWTPLRTTPPIPDYDSAHATEGGAAAAVLAAFFGDRTHFSACSISEPASDNSCIDPNNAAPQLVREFRSFSQAAQENAVSRIYVGFHFRKAAMDGVRHGRLIGAHAARTTFRPAWG
jgi:hypothetical protein